jgi:hypothetical protein
MMIPFSENPRLARRNALVIALVALGIVFILWNVPALSFLLYPFRLFVTYVHEAGHSLMAVLTGGSIAGFAISADGSGVAQTIGGNRALILPAGYLGAAFFGAALFYIINTVRYPRSISVMLGIMLIVFSVMFAVPDHFGAPLALFIGTLFGAALIGMGWKVSRVFNLLILNIMSMITSLNAVMDVFSLTRNTSATIATGRGVIRNDAAAFSQQFTPLIPAEAWALVWAALAILMLGVAIYFSVIRPLRTGDL